MTARNLYTYACFATLALGSCSRTHQDGVSTETGNPPIIERDRIALVLVDGEAHVVGEPGAIDPPRGVVEVTIERTDDTARGPVERDGSFDVEVEARLGDAFSLRVVVAGEASPRVRFASTNDAGTSEPDAAVSDAGETCVNCIDEEITWRRVDPDGVFPELPGLTFTLFGCNTFMTRNEALEKCSRGVEQCMAGMGSVSIATVKSALETDAVQSALDEGGEHGEPAAAETFMYEITVGDRTITYRSCHGGPDVEVPCGEASPALEGLIGRLTELADAYACSPTPDCDSRFDPGPGEATAFWYWHDPLLNACVSRRGSAEGGANGNLYATANACLAACPEPEDESDCREKRVWSDQGCFACGLAGGCLYIQNFCPLPCEEDVDCDTDNPASIETELTCNTELGMCRPTFTAGCE